MKPLDPLAIPLHGTRLIEANAGTGKTYTIATLYVRLLLERPLDVGQLLVVTYTNAATAELRRTVRDRLADVLGALRAEHPADDAAVRELVRRRRAAGTVGADCARLAAALYGFDEAAIFTIHGFCQRVLQEHAFESGVAFDTELVGDQRLLVDDVVRDFWSSALYAAPPELVRCFQKQASPATLARLANLAATHPDLHIIPARPQVDLAAIIAAGGDIEKALQRHCLQLKLDLVDYARDELRRRNEASHTQSFDDLLQRLGAALQGPVAEALAGKIRGRFPAALIDEFQDTDSIQYRIFARVYCDADAALFLIGDPKQAIYGFRGADVFTYVSAKQRVDDAYTLAVNWRSSPSLVRAVNALYGRARAQFVMPGIPFSPSQAAGDGKDELAGAAAGRAPLRLLFVGRPGRPVDKNVHQLNKGRDVLGWFHTAIAGEIVRVLNDETCIGERRVVPGDIAVLCRTNQQSADLQTQLGTLGVPSVMYGEASVFETPEGDAAARVIRAMADPGDDAAVGAALLTPILGLNGDDLIAARNDDQLWEGWVERFQTWNECWQSSGFAVAFRRLLDDRDVLGRILSRPGGERCITNVLHLGELLQAATLDGRRGPRALVEWLQRMRDDDAARAEEAAEAAQIRLESDTHALTLVTIHKSKGLQYPVVVCPFLWDGMLLHPNDQDLIRFHAPEDGDRLTLDLGSEDVAQHQLLAEREALAENLRLLYVALTRARHLCIVAWGQFKNCETSALGYLLHQPAEAPDHALFEKTRDRIKSLTDAAMCADLEELAAVSSGTIEVTELSADPPQSYRRPVDSGAPLTVRVMSRELRQRWRMASFSALTASDRSLPEPVEEGLDRDETAPDSAAAVEAVAAPAVRGFPRGRNLGSLVHKLFETIDFAQRDSAALRAHTLAQLPAYGIEPQWADALAAAVTDVLDTPLTADPSPLTLRDLPTNRRLNELEFVCPVALGADQTRAGVVTAARLGDVFAAHGEAWLAGTYAARVRRLPVGSLAGYLRGYIDLVFEHGGRWFIVDYKTNDLGTRAEDYSRSALLADMQRHHYLLQYHLYAVAVHRYLQQRLAGYEYAQHFGGVLYLFVRGMAPSHARGCGVFFDRPAGALIGALSDLLQHPRAEVERTA